MTVTRVVIAMVILCSTVFAQSLDDQIKAKEQAIATLQKTLDPKVQPILTSDADLRLWVSKSLLTTVIDAYNEQMNKHFHFGSTGEVGQLKNSNGGGAGCGWFVTLEPNSECRPGQSPHSACADMDIPHLNSTYNANGAVDLDADFAFSFAAQVHGHVKGPPGGPCSLFHWSCDCPIGGGAGTSVHVEGNQGGQISGRAEITSDQNSWFAYNLRLTNPQSIPITVSVSLQVPFDGSIQVGIPVTIPLPQQVLAAGQAPQVFDGDGAISVGNPPVLSRKYQITVTPFVFNSDSTGYAAKATAGIVWK